MSTPTQPTWIRKLQILYSVTLAVWIGSVIAVVTAAVKIGDWSGIGTLALFAPGLIYFFLASFRFSRQTPEAAITSRERLFKIQSATGIPAMVGAIVGFLPAAINIPMFFTMSPEDQAYNAGFLVPWAMVYFFTITYVVAASIRRGLKAQSRAAEIAANPPVIIPVVEPDTTTASGTNVVDAADKTPSVRKLPIAPTVFFVVGIMLAFFTIQTEISAYGAARDGNLTNLSTPGFAFSFIQFIDLFLGNAAAVVVLIFGIINWPRDTSKIRRISTPLLAAFALAVTPGSLALAIVSATGVSPETQLRYENAATSWNWISNVAESGPPEGFELIDSVTDCGSGEGCVDPDSSVTFTRIGDHESNAEFVCTSVVAWAFTTGASDFAVAPDYAATPFGGVDDASAIQACVEQLTTPDTVANAMETYSPTFRFIGNDNDVPFQMDLIEIRWGKQSTDPGAHNYVFTIATTFQPDDLLPGEDQLSEGTHELNDLLTTIGQARLAHPDIDPNDAGLIREALTNYNHDIPITPIVDADGKIRMLELTTSDEPEVQCLSIAPWNEEVNGIPDPGTGYGVSSAETLADLKKYGEFGTQVWGSCTE
ncbi:MAG: hypothetical protein ACKOWN_06300 [Microbacteriaceae bacterium]